MVHRLNLKVVGLILVFSMIVLVGIRIIRGTTEGKLWLLPSAQRHCVEQIVSDLVYLKPQADSDFVTVGYLINDDYYIEIFDTSQSGQCDSVFHELVWHLETFGPGTSYEKKDKLSPHDVQWVNLTNSSEPIVYVWFDVPGVGKHANAKHIFFMKQMDGTYQAILTLELCDSFSSVHITAQDPPTLIVENDLICDWPSSDPKSYAEYSLWSGVPIVVRSWRTGEFSQ